MTVEYKFRDRMIRDIPTVADWFHFGGARANRPAPNHNVHGAVVLAEIEWIFLVLPLVYRSV